MTPLEEVRAAIIAAVPEIKSLPKYPYNPDAAQACVALASLFSLAHVTQDMETVATAHIAAYQEQQKSDYIRMLQGRYEGRPITLADVLIAIGSVVSGVDCILIDGTFAYLESAGQDDGDYHEVYQSKVGPRGGTLKDSKPIQWNLALSYDDQEDEVKRFVGKVLGV